MKLHEYLKKNSGQRNAAVKALREEINKGNIDPSVFFEDIPKIMGALDILEPPNDELSINHEFITNTKMFSYLVDGAVAFTVLEGYNSTPDRISEVFRTVKRTHKDGFFGGMTSIVGAMQEVGEGQPVPFTTRGEKDPLYYHAKKFATAIQVTEEMVREARTGEIAEDARRLGEEGRRFVDELMVSCVVYATGHQSYYLPSNSATAFYATTGSIINDTTGNPLEDWRNINNVMKLVSGITDENGRAINIVPDKTLVPYALAATAMQIKNATTVEKTDKTVATSGQNTIGATPIAIPGLVVSNMLGSVTPGAGAAATNWYMVDSSRAFYLIELSNGLEIMSNNAIAAERFHRDIVTQNKIKWEGTPFVASPRHIFRSRA